MSAVVFGNTAKNVLIQFVTKCAMIVLIDCMKMRIQMNCKCGTHISKNADNRNRTQLRCARCCRLQRESKNTKIR